MVEEMMMDMNNEAEAAMEMEGEMEYMKEMEEENNTPVDEEPESEGAELDYEALGIITDEPLVPINSNFTAEQIRDRLANGTISVVNPIQRSWRWEVRRCSLLIHSMAIGIPIPPIWAKKVYGGKTKKGNPIWIYDILDGKQRILAIAKFLNNEYALKDVPPVLLDGKVIYLNGLTFSELPEKLQTIIKDTLLTFKGFDNITDVQLKEVFKRLNNGKPLTGKEKSIANCTDIANLTEMGKHPFFAASYTEKSLETRKQIPILMKVWIMLHEDVDTVSFENSDMDEAMENNVTTEADRREISLLLDKALAIYNCIDSKYTSRKFANETNFVSLVPFIKRAMEMEIPDSLMADFVQEYLGRKVSVSDVYALNAKQGSGKNSAVLRRHEELEKAWDEFFSDDTLAEATSSPEEAVKDEETIKPNGNPSETETLSEDVLEEGKTYRYGMRFRGFAPGCQPNEGLVGLSDEEPGQYHDIIIYNRELTDEELAEYELDRLA